MKRIGLALLVAVLSMIVAADAEAARKPRTGKGNPTVRTKKKNKTEKTPPKGGLIDPFGDDSKLPSSTGPGTGGSGGTGGGGGGKFIDPFAPPSGGGSTGGGTGSGGGGKFIDPFAPSSQPSGGGKKK